MWRIRNDFCWRAIKVYMLIKTKWQPSNIVTWYNFIDNYWIIKNNYHFYCQLKYMLGQCNQLHVVINKRFLYTSYRIWHDITIYRHRLVLKVLLTKTCYNYVILVRMGIYIKLIVFNWHYSVLMAPKIMLIGCNLLKTDNCIIKTYLFYISMCLSN